MKLLIGEKIKECGLTQKELAERIGLSPSHLANIISERRGCDVEMLVRISDALNVSVASLIDDEKSKVVGGFTNGNERFEIHRIG